MPGQGCIQWCFSTIGRGTFCKIFPKNSMEIIGCFNTLLKDWPMLRFSIEMIACYNNQLICLCDGFFAFSIDGQDIHFSWLREEFVGRFGRCTVTAVPLASWNSWKVGWLPDIVRFFFKFKGLRGLTGNNWEIIRLHCKVLVAIYVW